MIHGNEVIFGKKTFNQLLEDIYNNSEEKKAQINEFLDKLHTLIQNSADAALMIPVIKEYLEISVKNDEHLIKLALVIQRLLSSNNKNNDIENQPLLPESEKQKVLEDVELIKSEKNKVKELENKANIVIKNIKDNNKNDNKI